MSSAAEAELTLDEMAGGTQPCALGSVMAQVGSLLQERMTAAQENERKLAPFLAELDRLLAAGRWDLLCPGDGVHCNAQVSVELEGERVTGLECPAWSDSTCPYWADRKREWDADDLARLGFQRELLYPVWPRVPEDSREALRVYCATISTRLKRGEGLVIGGRPGSGKSEMLALVALALAQKERGEMAQYVGEQPAPFRSDAISYVKSPRLFDDLYRGEEKWHNPHARLLLIDDLGTEWRSEGSWVRFGTLIDDRWGRLQSTIITTNLSRAELTDNADMGRMISRLSQRNPWLWTEGQDQRQKASVSDWAAEAARLAERGGE